MKKSCEACGKTFEAVLAFHKKCPDCFRGSRTDGRAAAVASPSAASPSATPPPRAPHNAEAALPSGYLADGYFNDRGGLHEALVTTWAEAIARGLAGPPKMPMHQLRRFFNHVRRLDRALSLGRPFAEVLPEVKKLKPFAVDAAGRKESQVPQLFTRFIDANVDCVTEQGDFARGFLEHFQAVVAYAAKFLRG